MTNCPVGRVPQTLNAPGLLDFDVNSIHFQKPVYMDLAASEQEFAFTLKEPSVFRVLVEEHERVDIDLHLFQTVGSFPNLTSRKCSARINSESPRCRIYLARASCW